MTCTTTVSAAAPPVVAWLLPSREVLRGWGWRRRRLGKEWTLQPEQQRREAQVFNELGILSLDKFLQTANRAFCCLLFEYAIFFGDFLFFCF